MPIVWTPDVIDKTDENVNPLQQMLALLAELLKLSLKKWNMATISGSQGAQPQFPIPADAITWSPFQGVVV